VTRAAWLSRLAGHRLRPRVRVEDEQGVRRLYIGSDTVQSAMRLDDPVALELAYTRAMLASLLFRPEPRRAALVGLGGGSLAKFMLHAFPDCEVVAVEPDAQVIEAAYRHFALPAGHPRLRILQEDGASWMTTCPPAALDLILVDAFGAHGEAEACAGAEFLRAAAAALTGEGTCALNLWNHARSYPGRRDCFLDVFRGARRCCPSPARATWSPSAWLAPAGTGAGRVCSRARERSRRVMGWSSLRSSRPCARPTRIRRTAC